MLGHRVGLLHLDTLQHAHLHVIRLLQRADRLVDVARQVMDLMDGEPGAWSGVAEEERVF